MTSVEFKVGGVVLATIALFTLIANIIPQVQSDVPMEVAFGADVSPEELVAAGEQLYHGAGGCTACHAETAGARAPNLATDYQGLGSIGERCGDRVAGMACKEYLFTALVRPMEDMVDDYPPIMPPVDRAMSPPQVWALVAYLESLGGEVTVSGADIPQTPAGGEPGAEGAGGAGAVVASDDPEEIVRILCIQCHVLGGEGTELGPPLDGVGGRRAPDEIRTAILDPTAAVAEGYQDFVGLMPPTFGSQLTAGQLEAVVRYLSGLR
ncbi:MAG: c-type cytochrome [Gemmatimonadota bacterium]